jgi:hypothetical protein
VPEARVALMPPMVALAPGSIGKNRPVSLISRLSCSRVTPASTVTVRSSALTCTMRFMRDRSTLTPPCTASRWPSSEEPTPKGMTGTACAVAWETMKATSSVDSQNTTASGGAASYTDSPRPCWSRTAAAVEQRSPKRTFSASSIAGGMGRRSTRGCRSFGAFMAVLRQAEPL